MRRIGCSRWRTCRHPSQVLCSLSVYGARLAWVQHQQFPDDRPGEVVGVPRAPRLCGVSVAVIVWVFGCLSGGGAQLLLLCKRIGHEKSFEHRLLTKCHVPSYKRVYTPPDLGTGACVGWQAQEQAIAQWCQRPKTGLRTSNWPSISGPFNKFHFSLKENVSDVGEGESAAAGQGPE